MAETDHEGRPAQVSGLDGQRGLYPLPRSIVRPTRFELLDGPWRFVVDLKDRGLVEHWHLGHAFPGTAQWPGTIEAELAAAQATQQHTPAWQDRVVAWYEREFVLPASAADQPAPLYQITFGACGYETRVWLNGHPLQTVEGEDIHFGEYTSFSYELPPSYLLPINRLTVRIADSLDAEIPRGKQESRVYKRGGIWYQTISGPVRSIWLEPIERNRLRSRLVVRSQIETQLVECGITTRIHDPGIYTVRLVVAEQDLGATPRVAEFQLPLAAGEQQQYLPLHLPGAALWSPAAPNLYHLTVQLIGPDGGLSQIETHLGLRNIEARDCAVYLNNAPLYLNGVLYQPATASFEQMRQHLLAMKALGCNLVRVHIAGIDPRIYALADEIGMLLWIEVPSPHSSSQASRANHRAELLRMLVMITTHPSVVIVSLYNEDWGAQDIATNPETRGYIRELHAYLRLTLPQVLVVDNDGWHHVSSAGRLESDLLTVHLYTADLARWRADLDRLVAGALERVTAEALVVGDPFFYRGQLPLIVSEWGGFGFAAYGGPDEPRSRAELIRAFKQELHQRPIGGDVYTQAVSIEEEVNGLVDGATGALLVPPGVLG